MPLIDNERIQELALMAGDKASMVNRKFWFALVIAIIAAVPAYYVFKFGLAALIIANYDPPEIIYTPTTKQPLQVLEKKFFRLTDNAYSGYVRVKNIELEWGVPRQEYTAEFKTYGGTVLAKVEGTAFILPASEKLIVFSRFTADQKPDDITFALKASNFIRKPSINFSFDLERVTVSNNSTGLIVSAVVKNTTAFTINRIHLPVLVYDNNNQIVGVSFTFINDVLSGESRSFQYTWPTGIPGAARAEIFPEINVFDKDVLQLLEGVSPINGRE